MNQTKALRFVRMIGVVSLFADFTYEGSRSVTRVLFGRHGRQRYRLAAGD